MPEDNPHTRNMTIRQAMELALKHHQAGRLSEAEKIYRQILIHQPKNAEVLSLLSAITFQSGDNHAALELINRAIVIDPGMATYYNNMGWILTEMGRLDQAMTAFRTSLELNPDRAEVHNNLGNVLNSKGQLDEAMAEYLQAIALKSDYAEAHSNLGNVLKSKGQFDQAIAEYHQAIALNPQYAKAHSNLGVALQESGQLDQAIASFRKALAIKPDFHGAYSNLLYGMHFHPGYDARAIYDEHVRWNGRIAEPLKKFIQPHAHSDAQRDDPERRLKIGYVSPDFRKHVVGWNLLPLLREHDHKVLEIFCYSGVLHHDAVTEQIRSCADKWRNIGTVTDERAARMIRNDGIDILVDLTLHMAGNRLLVFARKPAPVQVTYLGYCSTTGQETMDYRLSDPYLDPPETDLSVYTEQTLRLPRTYWCYQPGGAAPDPAPPPALSNGTITFGCLNNFAKVSPAAMDLWSKILLADKQTRLLIHANPGVYLDEVRRRFTDAGISSDRVEFIGRRPSWLDYINTYNRIDIALDPFPYSGWITTCDGLWMGVPVVTLSGQTAAGRGGRSILSNVGLTELIAQTPEEYVAIAVKLASDLPRLAELHRTLRQRMEASPLMDAPSFARNIEAAYRQMWRRWCSGTAAPRF
jgi:protein O-GlcNAc transferase